MKARGVDPDMYSSLVLGPAMQGRLSGKLAIIATTKSEFFGETVGRDQNHRRNFMGKI